MKTRLNLIRTVCLTIILAFTIASIAGAGAVIRRGSSNDKNTSKKSDKPAVTRQSQSRDSGRSQPQVRDSGKSQSQARDNNRSQPSKPTTPRDNGQSSTYRRQSEPARPSIPSGSNRSTYRSSEQARPASPVKMNRDRSIPDATPSYRQTASDSRTNRSRTSEARHTLYKINRDRINDKDFIRINERDGHRSWDNHKPGHVAKYRPPVYRGGYYYYDCSWPHFYEYPLRYRYWVFEVYPDFSLKSVYYYYGYFPYIPTSRVVIISRPTVRYVETPIVIRERSSYDTVYYLDQPGYGSLDRALADIRDAWVYGNPDLILRYVRSNERVDVLLDGEYSYSVDGSDYSEMTIDAIESLETIDFTFEAVRSRGDNRVIAYGKHRFYDIGNTTKTVYVSYELKRRGSDWYITEVGSSLRSLGY